MKIIKLLLGISLLCPSSWAQQPLINLTYADYESNSGVSILVDDDGYTLVGVGYVLQFNGKAGIKMLRVDTTGNLQWKYIYGDSILDYSVGHVGSTIRSRNGRTYITYGRRCNTNSICNGLILKQDLNGDTIWAKTYGGSGRNLFNHGLELPNGDLIAVGRSSVGTAPEQVWLTKTDSLGNLIWQKSYGGSSTEEARTVLQTQDKGYLLIGYTESFASGRADAYVIKTDSVGNMQWQKSYGTDWKEYSAQGILSSDGGFYIWGNAQDDKHPDEWPTYAKRTYISKIEQDGDLVWTKVVHEDLLKGVYINQIKEYDSGRSLVIVGQKDMPFTDVGAGWVAKLDSSGNFLWERFYVNPDNNDFGAWLYDFQFLATGGIACTGSGNVPGTIFANQVDFWLLVLDSMGCLVPGCDTLVGMENVGASTLEARLYPNPATNTLTIELPGGGEGRLTLYNLLGQEVFGTATHGHQTAVGLSLPPGVYIYRITQGTQHANGKLLVE